MNIKNTRWILFLFLPLLFACPDKMIEDLECGDTLEPATIIGQDFRRCVCCGGWFITVGPDTLRTFFFPEEANLAPPETFPIEICIEYTPAAECQVWNDLIEISKLELRK